MESTTGNHSDVHRFQTLCLQFVYLWCGKSGVVIVRCEVDLCGEVGGVRPIPSCKGQSRCFSLLHLCLLQLEAIGAQLPNGHSELQPTKPLSLLLLLLLLRLQL